MTEAREKRFARRLQVRFWKRGSSKAHTAYSTNISAHGMFIATSAPLPPGARLRIEVLEEGKEFIVEAVVAHAARVSPLLKKLRDSGMGVRFLSLEELIRGVLPASELGADDGGEARAGGEADVEEAESADAAARVASSDTREGTAQATSSPAPAPVHPLEMQHAVFKLEFPSLPSFLSVLERDIEAGGIFITSSEPASLHERITVEIHIPPPVAKAVRFPGRVVHVVDAAPDGDVAPGMGVEFADPDRVVRELHSLVYAE